MPDTVNPIITSPEERSKRKMQISKVEAYLRLLKLVNQSADILTAEPVRSTVLKKSMRAAGHEAVPDELWHHYQLTEETPDAESGPVFMLRLPDCAITVVYNPGGYLLPPEWEWTQRVGLDDLTESQIGAITSAINNLVDKR